MRASGASAPGVLFFYPTAQKVPFRRLPSTRRKGTKRVFCSIVIANKNRRPVGLRFSFGSNADCAPSAPAYRRAARGAGRGSASETRPALRLGPAAPGNKISVIVPSRRGVTPSFRRRGKGLRAYRSHLPSVPPLGASTPMRGGFWTCYPPRSLCRGVTRHSIARRAAVVNWQFTASHRPAAPAVRIDRARTPFGTAARPPWHR